MTIRYPVKPDGRGGAEEADGTPLPMERIIRELNRQAIAYPVLWNERANSYEDAAGRQVTPEHGADLINGARVP